MAAQNERAAPQKYILRNCLITLFLLILGVGISTLLLLVDDTGGFVSMIFVLMVVLIARLTEGFLWGVAASFVSVICVNYIFTYPYWEFNFTISGYPLTFLTMLSVSLIVSTLTTQIKRQEQLRVERDRESMRANLLRAVSHDLRTPLTSIVGATSAILENEELLTSQQRTSLLRTVRDEAQWLIHMVENLLSITRMGADEAHIEKMPELAEEVLSSAAAKFQKQFPGVHLALSAGTEPLFVPMDATLIQQVLMNLLENAAYHGHCTAIRLSALQEGEYALFTVADNGCGVPADLLHNIFSPSTHARPGIADDHRNMGIGLSVCRSIVDAHGGRMTAGNQQEGGAIFSFTLPLDNSLMEEQPDEN